MKGKNNTRKTRKTKEVLTRMTSALRPLKHDAEHEPPLVSVYYIVESSQSPSQRNVG
jgi:hypothetical protein